jgi:hypothetical protein
LKKKVEKKWVRVLTGIGNFSEFCPRFLDETAGSSEKEKWFEVLTVRKVKIFEFFIVL